MHDIQVIKDQLAQTICQRYKEMRGSGQLTYVREPYSLVCGERTQYLDNAFAEFQQGNAAKKQHIINVVAAILLKPMDAAAMSVEEMKTTLLPCIRERFFFELSKLQMRLHRGVGLEETPRGLICDELVVHFVLDSPTQMKHVTKSDLEKMGIDFSQAMELGLSNLRQRTPQHLDQIAPGLYVGPWADSNAPARLLFPELFNGVPLKGYPVAVAVNRDTVIFTGSEDTENHPHFIKLIYDALKQPRPMSPHLIILKENGWNSWKPETDSPAYDSIKTLRTGALGNDYLAQKTVLDQIHDKENIQMFIPKLSSIKENDIGRETTFCVWGKASEPWLLPKADLIMFNNGQKGIYRVPWEVAIDRLGHLMKKQDFYPERYLVTSFPSDIVLQEICLQE